MSFGQQNTGGVAPEQQWYMMIAGVVSGAINVVETLSRARLVYDANDIQQLIDAATDGGPVGSSTMTKAQASALNDLITTFAVYLNTPMTEGGLKPIQVLFRQWAPPVTDETL
jgi:hypothetical protein